MPELSLEVLAEVTSTLTAARLAWDNQPGWRPAAVAYDEACAGALPGVSAAEMHTAITVRLSWTVGYRYTGLPAEKVDVVGERGATVPDAVQSAVIELASTPPARPLAKRPTIASGPLRYPELTTRPKARRRSAAPRSGSPKTGARRRGCAPTGTVLEGRP